MKRKSVDKELQKENSRKKSKKGLAVAAVLLVGCLGVGGFFVYKYIDNKNKDDNKAYAVEHKNVVITSSYGGSVNLDSGSYSKGEKLSLVATAEEGYEFTGWIVDGDGELGDANSASTTFTVPEGDVVVSAAFRQIDMKELSADEKAVYRAVSGLRIQYSDGDYAGSVIADVVLPSEYGEDMEAVSVSWASSAPEVVSEEGVVTRGEEKQQVTLTATFKKGDVTQTKDYDIKVVAKSTIKTDEITNNTINDIQDLNEAAGTDLRLQYNDDATQLARVSGIYSEIEVDSVESALYSLCSVKGLIGLEDPLTELKWSATNYDSSSVSYTFAQLYKGTPVYGTTITVVADINTGKTQALRSSLIGRDKLANMADYGYTSIDELKSKYDVVSCDSTIYALDDYENSPVMAMKVTTNDEVIIVSCTDGSELLKYSSTSGYGEYVATGKGDTETGDEVTFPVSYSTDDGTTYYLEDIERGIYVYGDDSGSTAYTNNANWADATAVSAYTNVITVYDWMSEELSRDSIDGNGSDIIVNVHDYKDEGLYGTAHYETATNEMCFFDNENGTTPSTASDLDAVAHEMIHGMFGYMLAQNGQAEIPYAGDAGAIYEGYADVMSAHITGESITNVSTATDAEEVSTYTDAQHVPNFQNHGSYATPTSINDDSFYTGDDADIYVHTNSNLVTNLDRLLMEQGLTEDEVIMLWYNSMMLGFDAHSGFDDLRDNLEQAGINLGFSNEKQIMIMQAFDDEEIYSERGSLVLNFAFTDGSEVTEANLASIKEVTLKRIGDEVPNQDYVGTATSFENIYYGDYELSVEFDGYVTYNGIVTIEENMVTEATIHLLSEGTGNVEGLITSATTGEVLKGVKLTVYSGHNTKTGDEITSFTTKADGKYSFELPAGFYTIKLSKNKFVDSYVNIVSDGGKTLKDVNASISAYMELGSSYRIVLSWGSEPSDLDAHLTANTENYNFEVYYANQNGYDENRTQVANLDVDDRSAYGPETVTFTVDALGTYEYFIDWYTGSGTWTSSNAKVEVYNGSMLAYVYNVPIRDDSSGDWHIFSITNGIYKSINEIY